ncbi:hypothetical protein ACS127_12060 [Amphibacillus sp. Q70]|uniref:hypothetical protein n=1 Tax=Amphibacillus sp. Q70 TaxID=3453416 RepID=UPI003F8251CB
MGSLFSNVSSQLQTMLKDQMTTPLTLRQGQVILGKVTQIFPNQVASVQFGKHQIMAKLEIPLTAEQSYLFEVTSVEDLPQLKVMTSSGSNLTLADQILSILAKLNLSPTRENQQFIQETINNQIPIRQNDLEQALLLLKNDHSQETKTLLLDMLKEQLPITELTMQSMEAVSSRTGLVSQMQTLAESLANNGPLSQPAQQLLTKLLVILNREPVNEHNYTVNREQTANLGATTQDESNIQTKLDLTQVPKQNAPISASKLNLESDALLNQLSKQLALSEKQLFQFNKVLTNLNNDQVEPIDKHLEQLQTLLKDHHVAAKVAQQLPNQAAASLDEFIDQATPAKQLEFIRPLTELIQLQFPRENSAQIFDLLSQINQTEANLFPVKDQFLIHMKNYLLNSGLDFEHNLSENQQRLTEQPVPLKQLLLQVFAEQSTQMRETDNLLNLLTGQQLTLLNEDASFLHLSTHIPGLFGIEEDIEVEFYSRKDKEEKIDANYCRIAFYLELNQLGTTIIDMSVQNRVVHLTVYNDEDISDLLDQYKTLLKDGLTKLNYQLSTISYKVLPDDHEHIAIKAERNQQTFKQSSLDVRI